MACQSGNQDPEALNDHLSYNKSVIKNIGGGLVTVFQNKVYLLHQTTKEFLLGGRTTTRTWAGSIELQEANYVLAEVCIHYILLCVLQLGSDTSSSWFAEANSDELESRLSERGYVFLSYASKSWDKHLKLAAGHVTSDLLARVVDLCDPKSNCYSLWSRLSEALPHEQPDNDLEVMVMLDIIHIVGPDIITKVSVDAINHTGSDGMTLLHYAVEKESVQSVLFLLGSGADVNSAAKGHDGRTPLLFACQQHDSLILQLLLRYGASAESTDARGRSALELACQRSCLATAKILLEFGVNHRILDNSLYYVCNCARDAGDVFELVSLLLQSGANVNACVEKVPLLHCACESVEVLGLLLRRGADVHARSYSGSQAIHVACRQGNSRSLMLLLENGADVHVSTIDGQQAIHEACRYKHAEVVDLLLAHGADVHALTIDGRRPIHLACSSTTYRPRARNSQEVDANTDTSDEETYEPVHVVPDEENVIAIIEHLADYGADVNASDQNGQTPLHLVCWSMESLEVVSVLIEHKADVNISDKDGQQPLDLLLTWNSINSEMAKLLIQHGANAGKSNIMVAQPVPPMSASEQSKIMGSFIENGAHVQMENDPKTWAVYNKFLTGPSIIPVIGSKWSGKTNLIRLMGAIRQEKYDDSETLSTSAVATEKSGTLLLLQKQN